MTNLGKPVKVIQNEPAPVVAPVFVPQIKVPEPGRVLVPVKVRMG